MSRDPYDGLPYYCSTCGDPYPADEKCEESPALCSIETKHAAEARALRRRPLTTAAQPTEQS